MPKYSADEVVSVISTQTNRYCVDFESASAVENPNSATPHCRAGFVRNKMVFKRVLCPPQCQRRSSSPRVLASSLSEAAASRYRPLAASLEQAHKLLNRGRAAAAL